MQLADFVDNDSTQIYSTNLAIHKQLRLNRDLLSTTS